MNRRWQNVGLAILVVGLGAALRVPGLALRPMHGDEAVHTVKFAELWQTGRYVYDPVEFHGPTLYYLTLPSVWLSGARNFADTDAATYRIVPVIFGIGLTLLTYLIGRMFGPPAGLVAALLAACSPALVFYSRYYIQETLLAFFGLAAIGAGWRFAVTRHARWALLCGASLGLAHATKETSAITLGAMALGLCGTVLWQRAGRQSTPPLVPHNRPRGWVVPVGGALVALGVSVLLYSGFFTNVAGPLDSLRSYATWFERAGGTHIHDHPWHYYLGLLAYTHSLPGPSWSEGLILALATVGAVATLRRDGICPAAMPLARFLLLYTLLLTATYSAIPYKTPWCLVQFLEPMTLLAGVGAAAVWVWLRLTPARLAGAVALVLLTAQLAQQARAASFRFCADQRNPYVYAHPVRDVENLARWVEQLAAVSLDRERTPIQVIAGNPWPLPWYLRRFERVGYWEQIPPEPWAPLVIVDAAAELPPALADEQRYQTSVYGLRPGEALRVCADRNLYQRFVARIEAPR